MSELQSQTQKENWMIFRLQGAIKVIGEAEQLTNIDLYGFAREAEAAIGGMIGKIKMLQAKRPNFNSHKKKELQR